MALSPKGHRINSKQRELAKEREKERERAKQSRGEDNFSQQVLILGLTGEKQIRKVILVVLSCDL